MQKDKEFSSEGVHADVEATRDDPASAAPAAKAPDVAETEEAVAPPAAEVPAMVQADEVSRSAGAPSDVETAAMQDYAGSLGMPAGAGAGDEEADRAGADPWEALAALHAYDDPDSGDFFASEEPAPAQADADAGRVQLPRRGQTFI